MDCTKAQRLLQELPSSQLDEAGARHLSECSDCRVVQQRASRFQQLLSVKRHETPGPHYFDGFLSEFHHRLATETMPVPSLWERLLAPFHAQDVPMLRHGFAHACGVLFACGLILRGFLSADLPTSVSTSDSSRLSIAGLHGLPAPQSTPRRIASILPRPSEPTAIAGSALIIPFVSRGELNASRYVLDRISLSPASYEVASIQF